MPTTNLLQPPKSLTDYYLNLQQQGGTPFDPQLAQRYQSVSDLFGSGSGGSSQNTQPYQQYIAGTLPQSSFDQFVSSLAGQMPQGSPSGAGLPQQGQQVSSPAQSAPPASVQALQDFRSQSNNAPVPGQLQLPNISQPNMTQYAQTAYQNNQPQYQQILGDLVSTLNSGGSRVNSDIANQIIDTFNKGIQYGTDPNELSKQLQVVKNQVSGIKGYAWDSAASSRADSDLQAALGDINQALVIPSQINQQQMQIDAQTKTQKQQQEDMRKQLLGQVPVLQQQLSDQLLQQQNQAYKNIEPLILDRLNSMGILQSGALPEAQAKAFQNLESARQAQLAQFGTNATQALALQQPEADLATQLQLGQQGLQAGINLSNAGLQQSFAQQQQDAQNALQQQLSMQALQNARNMQNSQNQNALYAALIQGGLSGAGQAVGGAFSDKRLKKNIKPIGHYKGLPFYSFEFKNNPGVTRYGFMAQEVEKVYPEAVGEQDGYKTVNYNYVLGK